MGCGEIHGGFRVVEVHLGREIPGRGTWAFARDESGGYVEVVSLSGADAIGRGRWRWD